MNSSGPVAKEAMEAKDEIFLIGGDVSTLNRRAEIVHPSKTAAFTAADEAGLLRQSSPLALAFSVDVVG